MVGPLRGGGTIEEEDVGEDEGAENEIGNEIVK